jgi:hypothetical protein
LPLEFDFFCDLQEFWKIVVSFLLQWRFFNNGEDSLEFKFCFKYISKKAPPFWGALLVLSCEEYAI